eukprot:CAMPEP_0168591898 /NCGR_PEP_ID=MMETSP0420-20121227/7397_1 /TAXON_ID=498008 /ORGANISM="Pessonella sp." /LENGTH=193 /DNA_ID=CAMNT_0008627755 /DNA_START=133 /DNA_END=711 /DNA_ORIENTATION=+
MDDLTFETLEKVAIEARILVDLTGRKTINSREIQSAVSLVLPGELRKHAVSEGVKAVTKFCSNDSGGNSRGRRTTKSAMAGLQFPVGRIDTLLRAKLKSYRFGKGAAIYLAAVLEYLTAEVLELGGNCARDNKRTRIIPRHLQLAIRNDEELNRLYRGHIKSGGVIPNIYAMLLPKKTTTPHVMTAAPAAFGW